MREIYTQLISEPYDIIVASYIKERRMYAKLTQDELAKRVGVTQPTISKSDPGTIYTETYRYATANSV